MATFFGEVILPSSRAFFDDKDDSDYESEDCETDASKEALQLNVKDTSSLNRSYDVLILSDGSIAKDFVFNYILEEKDVVAELTVTPDLELHAETEMIYSKKLSTKPAHIATLYRINGKTLFLETSPNLKLKDANQLTLQVSGWLEMCDEILILASRPISDYKTDMYETLPQTFIRSLITAGHTLPPSTPLMEQPNFISGISASVMSWCEVKKMKCLLYVCYTDSLFSDSATLAPLLETVSNTKFRSLIHSRSPDHLKHNNPVHLNVMYQ